MVAQPRGAQFVRAPAGRAGAGATSSPADRDHGARQSGARHRHRARLRRTGVRRRRQPRHGAQGGAGGRGRPDPGQRRRRRPHGLGRRRSCSCRRCASSSTASSRSPEGVCSGRRDPRRRGRGRRPRRHRHAVHRRAGKPGLRRLPADGGRRGGGRPRAHQAFTGASAYYLRQSILRSGLDPDNLSGKTAMDWSKSDAQLKAWKDIWSAGQSVNAVQRVEGADEIIARLRTEYREALSHPGFAS